MTLLLGSRAFVIFVVYVYVHAQIQAARADRVRADGVAALKSVDLKDDQVKIVEVNTAKNQYPSFAFSRVQGKVYALSTVCTHSGCKVVADKSEIVCNCHMSYFSPVDGAALAGPARLPLTRYEVTERDGTIYIKP